MAASDTTRLLVLGVARLFEPANGYQLRRELLSWSVESWASINPGSIYSMLTTLTNQGMLERFDLPTSGSRPVAVYRSTDAGKKEIVDLVRSAITTVQTFDRTPFYAALSLSVSLLTRAEVIELLDERLANLASAIADLQSGSHAMEGEGSSPPHVARMFNFPVALDEAEVAWVDGFRHSVKDGEMLFADDDWSDWEPSATDPGWRMVSEAKEYLEKLPVDPK
jgi:DNA-binding PadR family transcriptional regulator